MEMTWAEVMEYGILSDDASRYFEQAEEESRAKDMLHGASRFQYRHVDGGLRAVQMYRGEAIAYSEELLPGSETIPADTWGDFIRYVSSET